MAPPDDTAPAQEDGPLTKAQRLGGAAVTLGALTLLAVHLAWGTVRLDGPALALVVIALVPWLGPFVQSIDIGGNKVEFRRQLRANEVKLEALHRDIKQLSLNFAGDLTPALVKELQDDLVQFNEYLKRSGVSVPDTAPDIVGDRNTFHDQDRPAYFDHRANEIRIHPRYATDPDHICSNYAHRVLTTAHPRPADEESLAFATWFVAETALAGYYVCSFRGDPTLFRVSAQIDPDWSGYTFANDQTFAAEPDKDVSGPSDILAWGGVFWTARDLLDPSATDRLLFEVWRSTPDASAEDSFHPLLARELVDAVEHRFGAGKAAKVRDELNRRQLAPK